MSKEDMDAWYQSDPEGYQNALDLYNMGVKAKGVWSGISGPLTKLASILGIVKTDTKDTGGAIDKVAQSPFIQWVQGLIDPLMQFSSTFTPLTSVFNSFEIASRAVGDALQKLGIDIGTLNPILAVLGFIVGIVAQAIAGAFALAINWIADIVGFVASVVADVITLIADIAGSVAVFFQGFADMISGLFNGDAAVFLSGIAGMLAGIIGIVLSAVQFVFSLIGDVGLAIFNLLVDAVKNIVASVVTIFGGKDAGLAVTAWFDGIKDKFNASWDTLKKLIDTIRDDIVGWWDDIVAKFQAFSGFKIDLSTVFAAFPDLNNDGDPGFASGAVVSKPTRAWVGEGGQPEAIMPLSTLPGLFNQMYGDQMANAYAHAGGGGGAP